MSFSSLVSGAKLFLKANAPTIKVVAGISLAAGGAVVACKATLKAQEIVGSYQDDKNEIEALEDATKASEGLAKRRVKLVAQLGADYAPAVGLFAVGTALILNGHFQLKKRYVAATTAAAAFQNALVKYRKAVADRYGEAEENDIWNGVTRKSVKYKDKDGKHVEVVPDEATYVNTSPLTVLLTNDGYDPIERTGSHQWINNRPDLNVLFVRNAVRNAQQQLQLRGFLSVYEFLTDYLGCEPEALALDNPTLEVSWGWRYTVDDSDPTSDNYIDVGLFDKDWHLLPVTNDYLKGYRDNLPLNLNATPLFMVDNRYENKVAKVLNRKAPDEK